MTNLENKKEKSEENFGEKSGKAAKKVIDIEKYPLTSKHKQFLKSLGHSRNPVVMIGKNGLTENVSKEIEIALERHELIKVKVSDENIKELAQKIARESGAAIISVMGKIVMLYLENPEDSRVVIPGRKKLKNRLKKIEEKRIEEIS